MKAKKKMETQTQRRRIRKPRKLLENVEEGGKGRSMKLFGPSVLLCKDPQKPFSCNFRGFGKKKEPKTKQKRKKENNRTETSRAQKENNKKMSHMKKKKKEMKRKRETIN